MIFYYYNNISSQSQNWAYITDTLVPDNMWEDRQVAEDRLTQLASLQLWFGEDYNLFKWGMRLTEHITRIQGEVGLSQGKGRSISQNKSMNPKLDQPHQWTDPEFFCYKPTTS